MASMRRTEHHHPLAFAAFVLFSQMSIVHSCIRLSPNIEAKIAGLTSTGAPRTTVSPRTSPLPPTSLLFTAKSLSSNELLPRVGVESNSIPRSVASSTQRSAPRATNTTQRSAPRAANTTPFMYTNRYDFVSIEHVLRSPRLMRNFHECMMGRGPCTSEGSELKRIVPEALNSNCARCTERQRVQAGKVLAYLLEHRREWWSELLEKFDPDGRFRRQYEYEQDDARK